MVDFTGFGWKNMDAKSAIQLLKQAQDHAPERLKKLVAYDPPLLFWTLWRVSARGETRRPSRRRAEGLTDSLHDNGTKPGR